MSFGQAGSIIGNVIGSYFGPVGGAIGSSIGGLIGSQFDPSNVVTGPRLSDLKTQNGAFGTPIAVSFGTNRLAGTVIYLTNIRETKNRQTEGKGGGSNRTYNDTYTYDLDVAVVMNDQHGFAVKGITGVRRIWANGALVRTNSEDASLGDLVANALFCDQITVYPGDYNQLPDPTIEGAIGVGNVSAYRGFSYVVIKGLKVSQQGSPVPQMEFEVVQGGTTSVAKQVFATFHADSAYERASQGRVWIGNNLAMSFTYQFFNDANSDFTTTTFYSDGSTPAHLRFGNFAGSGTSNFDRQIANSDIPTTYDINFLTGTPTDGMSLRIWDMRVATVFTTTAMDPGGDLLIAEHFISVPSYPAASLTATNRVAYEQASQTYAFGHTGGSSFTYGGKVTFVQLFADTGFAVSDCVLPNVDRRMVDVAIFLGTLYVWNFDTNFSSIYGYHSYITTYDNQGNMLSDDAHWDSGDYTVHSNQALCVNEFGIFTWSDVGIVTRFTPSGPTVLCTTANSGDSFALENFDFRDRMGFWTDGSIANLGPGNYDGTSGNSEMWTVQFAAITKGFVPLNYALGTICRIAGLDDSEIQADSQTQTLRGYCYKQINTAATFLSPLCQDYFVEGSESEGKVKFVNIGGDVVCTIPYIDLGYNVSEENPSPDIFPLTRVQDRDLPRSVVCIYADWDNDFQIGSEAPARRITTQSQNDITYETPVTATADESVKRQDILLYKTWLERDTRKCSVSRKYIFLETSDAVMVEFPIGRFTRYRIVRIDNQGAVINLDLIRDEPDVLNSSARGSSIALGQTSVVGYGPPTRLAILDIPILRDTDDASGFYIAVGAPSSGWPGAEILQSTDGGVDFTSLGTMTTDTGVGTAYTALPDWAGGNQMDYSSVVRVNVGDQTLSNATRTALLNNTALNGMIIGQEIIQFMTATLITTGVYDLSGLLRYRRGTKWAATHQIGDGVVLLKTAGMRRIPDTVADRYISKIYKGVTHNALISAAPTVSFANTDCGLMPFLPSTVRKAYGASSALMLSWRRRSRRASRFLAAGIDAPLAETSEAYQIDIKNGTTLIGTLSSATNSVSVPTWSTGYTATIYQMSSAVGRGFGTTITL